MARWLLILLGIPLILIVLAAILIPMLVDKDKIVELAATTLQQQTGAVLKVGGDVGVSIFPTLGVSLENTELTLPDEAQGNMKVRSLEIGVALMPLLSSNIEIEVIRLNGLEATLTTVASTEQASVDEQATVPEGATLPEGTTLPDSAQSPTEATNGAAANSTAKTATGDSAPTIPSLNIDLLEITDSRISLVDEAAATTTVVELKKVTATNANVAGRPMDISATLALPNEGLTLQLDGGLRLDLTANTLIIDKLEQTLSGLTPQPLAVSSSGQLALDSLAADLKLDLSSGDAKAKATVKYSAANQAGGDAQLATTGELQGLELSPLLALAGTDLDLSGIAGLNWNLTAAGADPEALVAAIQGPVEVYLNNGSFNGQALTLSTKGQIDMSRQHADLQLDLTLAATKATGQLRYAGLSSPQIDAKLHLNLLDPALLALAGPEAAEEAEATDVDASSGDDPLPLEAIRAIDTRAELTIDKAVFDDYEAQNVNMKLRAAKGVVRITSMVGEAYGGKLDMKATFNAAEDEAKLNTKGGVTGLDIAQLLAAMATDPILEGKANLDWTLNSKGTTANQLFGDLRGPIKLNADKTVLKGIGIEKMLCEAVALVNQKSIKKELPESSKFRKLGIDIRMSEGKAHLSPIKAQLAHVGVTGEGVIDPLSQDFRITFKAKLSPSLAKLDPACKVNERLTGIDWPVDCRGKFSDDPAKLCSVATQDIIADMATNEVKRKAEKEVGRALENLFKK